MAWLETLVLVAHVIIAVVVVGLVLLQQGKGADAGASFGAGASQTVFGAQGSGNFLTRMTSLFAAFFFVSSFALAVFAKQNAGQAVEAGIPVPAAVESDADELVVPASPESDANAGTSASTALESAPGLQDSAEATQNPASSASNSESGAQPELQ